MIIIVISYSTSILIIVTKNIIIKIHHHQSIKSHHIIIQHTSSTANKKGVLLRRTIQNTITRIKINPPSPPRPNNECWGLRRRYCWMVCLVWVVVITTQGVINLRRDWYLSVCVSILLPNCNIVFYIFN